MTKKFILPLVVIVAVVALGVVGFVKSFSGEANTVIEHIENFTGTIEGALDNGVNNDQNGDGRVGITEFFNGVTFNQLAPNVLQERIVRVSAAQVASISFNPVELLADPGSGFTYDVIRIIAFRKFASEGFVYNASAGDDHEGFEVKWGGCCTTASGLNGAWPLGASFSTGFLTGNATNSRTSPSFEIWTPSRDWLNDDGVISGGPASKQYVPTLLASSSPVYLTASANFSAATDTAVVAGENSGEFFFRVIYRLINLNF